MDKKKIIIASILGNALEFYDFTLYGVFAATIARHFFPAASEDISLLYSLVAFASGFIMRPFGALVFGFIGDKLGRKKALLLSILLMGIPTFIIGILPSYTVIGIAAPTIIISCRLLQGLCTGGEYNGAAIYALEHVGKNHPGLAGSLITSSTGIGAMMAMGMATLASQPFFPSWSWRGPFILGAVLSLIGFYMRIRLEESPVFIEHQKNTAHQPKVPLFDAFRKHKKSMLLTIGFGGMDGLLSYILFVFLSTVYLIRYINLPPLYAMHLTNFGLLLFTLSCPVFGILFDKMGSQKYYKTMMLLVIITSIPTYFILQKPFLITQLIGVALIAIKAACIAGPQHTFVQKLFPVADRYTGIAFSFSLGMALLGGTAPPILTFFLQRFPNPIFPGIYVAFWAIIFFIILMRLRVRKYFE